MKKGKKISSSEDQPFFRISGMGSTVAVTIYQKDPGENSYGSDIWLRTTVDGLKTYPILPIRVICGSANWGRTVYKQLKEKFPRCLVEVYANNREIIKDKRPQVDQPCGMTTPGTAW